MKIGGNIRFFKYGDNDKLLERIRMVAENTAKAYGTTAVVTHAPSLPLPVINDPGNGCHPREVGAQSVGFVMAPPMTPPAARTTTLSSWRRSPVLL